MSARGWVVCERAQAVDLEALVQLDQQVSARAWTGLEFRAALRNAHQELLVLRAYRPRADQVPPQVLAYCAFQLLAPELEIHGLAVRADHQRQGWGRRLLRIVLAIARQRGAALAWLEVRAGNAGARGLYAAAGFFEVQRRREYYRDPPEDALILRSDLLPPRAREEP